MPIRSCQIDNNPGYKWGQQGKCYAYDPSSEESKTEAKKKAIAQAVAIGDLEALAANINIVRGTYKFENMAAEVIGMDFDGTLSTRAGQQLWKRLGGDFVITARSLFNLDEVYSVTDRLGIPRDRVIWTGSNSAKVAEVKRRGITEFYDNNSDVVRQLPGIGKLFRP